MRQEEIDRISRKLATLEMKVNPKRTDYLKLFETQGYLSSRYVLKLSIFFL